MKRNLLAESDDAVEIATSYLLDQKLVAIKTETVYGVSCDPSNPSAIKKLYRLKKRPENNPLIIHVNSINLAEKVCSVRSDAKLIMKKFWPGPLTLILPQKKNSLVHESALSNLDTIAVRYPRSRIMSKILKKLGRPIAAPSANISGRVSATDATHVLDSFGKNIDLIIDSGRCDFGLESTILDMTSSQYIIRRMGMIDHQKISDILGKKIICNEKNCINSDSPNSPGQLLKHYSPSTPLKINIINPKLDDAFLNFGSQIILNHEPTLNLSKSSDLNEAAYNLFFFLRKLDKLKKKRIVVAPIPNIGIGKTINERLRRAST